MMTTDHRLTILSLLVSPVAATESRSLRGVRVPVPQTQTGWIILAGCVILVLALAAVWQYYSRQQQQKPATTAAASATSINRQALSSATAPPTVEQPEEGLLTKMVRMNQAHRQLEEQLRDGPRHDAWIKYFEANPKHYMIGGIPDEVWPPTTKKEIQGDGDNNNNTRIDC